MPNYVRCRYCGKHLPTSKGLRLHITLKKSCRENRKRVLAKKNGSTAGEKQRAESVESVDDVEMEDVHNPPVEPANDHPTIPSTAKVDHGGKVPRWIETYPGSAGATKGIGQSDFEKLREQQKESGENLCAPFESQDKWELAQWLLRHVGHNATDDFLKLPIVSF